MLRRLGIVVAVLVLGQAPAGALASSRDIASTHAYVVAAYTALSAVVSKWSAVEAGIGALDRRFQAECPRIAEGSPQSEEEQKLAAEVAGALWASGYHTDAPIARAFAKAVSPLGWSNPAITRSARRLTKGLLEMTRLPIPDLCGDVRAWKAGGYNAVPADVAQFDRHVEAIEIKEIPRKLLMPYVQPSDRQLIARAERLDKRFSELEFVRGQDDWNKLLEILALNQ